MAIVVETGSGSSTADSYVSVADVQAGFDAMLSPPTQWATLTTAKKEAACKEATRILDRYVATYMGGYAGDQVNPGVQALGHGRENVTHPDTELELTASALMRYVREATIEIVRRLIASDLTKEPTRGLRSVKAGEVEVEFDTEQYVGAQEVPDEALKVIAPFTLNAAVRSSGGRIIRV